MTEVDLDGQATSGQSILFTGYRWENRFRLLADEHWINPVLYVEVENANAADKSLLEVVGHDGNHSLAAPNRYAAQQKNRELEAKLILGSTFRGWTIAEYFIAQKNVRHEPFEFGYAWVSAGLSQFPKNPIAATCTLGMFRWASKCIFSDREEPNTETTFRNYFSRIVRYAAELDGTTIAT